MNQNSVLTVTLNNKSSHLFDTLRCIEIATGNYSYDYGNFSKKCLNKYQKSSADTSFAKKVRILLNDKAIQEAYERLSNIPVVVLGDRVGGTAVGSSISNECRFKRLNIRVVIVGEEDKDCIRNKDYIRNLVSKINAKIARGIVYRAIKDLVELERERFNKATDSLCFQEIFLVIERTSVPLALKDSFANDFEKSFKVKLTFSFSDQFVVFKMEEKELVRKTIKGKSEASATIAYRQNPD